MQKILTGLCACPGEVTGTIQLYEEGKYYTKNDIVILNVWVTQNVAALKEAGGLISSTGGLTCHASIIAREFRIPCLVSVENIDTLKPGLQVLLDAAAEEITVYD